MTKRKQIQAYTEAFRREAVRLADEPGRTATDVARDLGIHPNQIYNWRTQFNKLPKGQFTIAEGTNYSKAEEIRRLKRRVAELEQERDFLKNVWSAPDLQASIPSERTSFASMYPAYWCSTQLLALME